MSKIIVLFTVLVFLVGCGGSDSGDKVEGNFDSKYYGQWLRVDTDEKINILHSTIIENYDIESDNLIKVNQDDTTYYLMRAGLSNIIVKGLVDNIESVSSTKKAPSRIGGVNVVLENVLDPNIKESVETDNDGSFKTSSLPAGTYKFKLDDKSISNITISKPIEDIGTYKLTGDNLHNFKAELILDDEFLYADEKIHKGKIRVHNISEQVGYGLYYTLNIKDNSLKSFSNELIKGSIEPKKYIDIPISLSFNKITKNSKTITVDVNINDVENNRWQDSFNFTLYKGYFNINIATEEDRVKGYIIMPNTHKVKNVDINGYGTIKLPLISDDKYHLLLSNTSFEDETAYSIGIGCAINSFENFNKTSAHEPNNNENTASNISIKESVISYLHINDLDYWKIAIPESDYLFDFTLKNFQDVIDVNLSQIVISNKIYIPEDIILDNNISIKIDKGNLVINDIDTNSTTTIVNSTDSIAIKLKAPSQDSSFLSSTLFFGQNSISFTLYTIDTTSPIFTSSSKFSIDENTLIVGKVKAQDKNNILYSILDQNNSDFNIDKTSGELKFKEKPNYEHKNIYELTVMATDTANNSTLQNIKVTVKDIEIEVTRSSDGIVINNKTDLMWQDNTTKKTSYELANGYCRQLVLGGHTTWYLPSISQLETLIIYDRKPAISPIFKNIHSSQYWSNSATNRNHNKYYTIDFLTGYELDLYESSSAYVRCVRKIKY